MRITEINPDAAAPKIKKMKIKTSFTSVIAIKSKIVFFQFVQNIHCSPETAKSVAIAEKQSLLRIEENLDFRF